ncbi:MAG: AraC family transcriptional regulator [Chthoniobacteraceae bacterium]
MSKSNFISGYRDPLTPVGVRLDGEELFGIHLHEAGCLKLSTEWSYPDVRSPFWRLYWSDRPGAWIECGGRRFDVETTRFLLVPAHTLFDTHGAARAVNHFWIHFSLHPDLIAKDNVPVRVPCGKGLAQQVEALAKKVRQPGATTPRQMHHLCSALLHQVFADPAVNTQPLHLPSNLYALLREIELSLAKPIPVTGLALRAGMSRGGFIRWFKQHMEVSPARYTLSRRIDHACRMLKFSSATIEEIAERLGFANRGHFSRVFQRQMGSGPAFFRKS